MSIDINAGANTGAGRERRFNVGDALILIAALCLSMASIRDRIRTLPSRVTWWLDLLRRFQAELARATPMGRKEHEFWVRMLASPVSDECRAWLMSSLLGLTCVQILIRLRRPRPQLRALLRQPGFVACCAACIGSCLDRHWLPISDMAYVPFPFWISMFVLVAWALLLGLRKSRAEPSWIDRLGRFVGAGWLVAGLWSLLDRLYP